MASKGLHPGPNSRHLLSSCEWDAIGARLKLTSRELEISRFVFDGLTELGIARRMSISEHTVHTHLGRLYKKLQVHGRAELIVAVFRAYVDLYRPSPTVT